MDRTTETMNRLFDCEVVDGQGNRIGPVENVWLDPATEQPEFIAVKTGAVMGRTHLVPVAGAQIDDANRQLRVPYSQDQIKNAPHFPDDADLSEAEEQGVYDHYGLRRSEAPSPTGLASGGGTTGRQEQTGRTGQDQQNLTLAEEELRVGKRPVEAGRARLRKVVRTERVQQPVELRREQVTIERVPASGQEVPPGAFQEQEIEVPLRREEPVVEKEAHVTGQVRVDKTTETEQRTVGGEVRREEVEVDRQGDVDVRGTGQERR